MEEPPCSSSSKSKTKGKSSNDLLINVTLLNEDLLHNILTRLPALSFASASCVSKSWNSVCNRIISRPKLASAISLNPSLRDAVNEVVNKVLSEPIRPYFAIVNIGCGFEPNKILRLIKRRLGFRIPVIVTVNNGIIGRDALTDEFKEVKWGALFSGIGDEEYATHVNEGIALTIGYLPGLKVEAIPLLRPPKTPQEPHVDSFIMDIKEYSASVSDRQFPVGIMLFGEASSDMKLVLEKLDYAMPIDTFIVGDERGYSGFRCGDDSRNVCGRAGYIEAVALVFAQDRNRSSGNIRFRVAFSNGVSPVGGRYKAASVRTNSTDCSTWLTAKREGQQELLDGQSILHDINTLLENHIEPPELYIGVTKHRKVSIGAEKPMPRTCIAYHGVVGGDEEYLYVDGMGIKTGDIFQFCHSNPNLALASLTEVHDAFNNIQLQRNSRSLEGGGDKSDNATNVFGGFIFACYGRGESFFERCNADSSPFLENFPGVPLAGTFCGGEMVRPCANLIGLCPDSKPINCFLHVYSTVYLVMSYDPPSVGY